ncbi:zinc finger protein with KRAB and SCAN domains 3 [Megalops cyprinoides]|uniref:zinc finger protein with KRAB and SCAN domains 3 n=1 Tax=Megalops cyprinoides TaxID=118141 RepID=UPI001863E45F|nr:zinc finger protein with KRAB and SCAN domains 3 [Megalops cyprinoides]
MNSPNNPNTTNNGGNRKQGEVTFTNRTSGQCFELKGEKTECSQSGYCETNLSVSSLKIRLAPTIQNTLAAVVDTLLNEVAAVLDDALIKTQQELVTREQENQRLRLRLEVSEGELKALQECLCSAQKFIDQLPVSFPGLPTLGQLGFASSVPSACIGHNIVDRDGAQPFGQQNENERDVSCLPVCNSELSGSLSDALQGFDTGDELKVCQLSIQADGTVTNHLLNSFTANSPNPWSDVNPRPATDRAAVEKSRQCVSEPEPNAPTLGPQPRFEIKQEQDQGLGQHGQMRAGEGGVAMAAESEQTAQNVGELGYIHVVEEEDGSRSLRAQKLARPPSQHPSKCAPVSDGLVAGLKALAKPHLGMRLGQVSSRGTIGAKGPPSANPGADPGDRPHLCLECGKTFRLISSLKKHIRIHTGEKPYPCGVCGRRFRESGALKTHQRIHTGEKPYSCSDCGTSFRHLDGLRKHRRTHTGEKPYACGICGKRLSRLQHLKHHQRIHTGERPCRCPRCHKSFKEPAALRKHLRTHKEEPGGAEEAGIPEDGVGAGREPAGSLTRLHPPMLPLQMGFGVWGADEEEGIVMNCV